MSALPRSLGRMTLLATPPLVGALLGGHEECLKQAAKPPLGPGDCAFAGAMVIGAATVGAYAATMAVLTAPGWLPVVAVAWAHGRYTTTDRPIK